MVVPEPVTIISLALGLIRNIITTYEDIHARKDNWGRYTKTLQDQDSNLDELRKRLKRWQRKWMILYEPEPGRETNGRQENDKIEAKFDALFTFLWGVDSTPKIYQRLQRVSEDAMELTAYVNTFIAKLDSKSFMRKISNVIGKTHLSTGGDAKIQKRWELIKTNMSDLEKVCDDCCRDKFAGGNDAIRQNMEISDRYIRRRVTQHMLMVLASRTMSTSDNLYTACEADKETLTLNAFTDLFDIPDKLSNPWLYRLEVILRTFVSEEDSLSFKFIVNHPECHKTLSYRMRVGGSTKKIEDAKHAFSMAFQEIWEGGEAVSRSSFISPEPGSACFEVERLGGSLPFDLDDGGHKEEIQNDAPKTLDLNRAKRAYTVAEFCFLLLKTKWPRGICRCRFGLRSFSPDSPEKAMIRPDFTTTEDSNPSCWCKGDLFPGTVRRLPYLGLLLGEIALGQPIRVVTSGNSPQFQTGNNPFFHLTLEQLSQKIQYELTSEKYADAVKYCLEGKLQLDNNVCAYGDKDLGAFYEKVLRPLLDVYDEIYATANVADAAAARQHDLASKD